MFTCCSDSKSCPGSNYKYVARSVSEQQAVLSKTAVFTCTLNWNYTDGTRTSQNHIFSLVSFGIQIQNIEKTTVTMRTCSSSSSSVNSSRSFKPLGASRWFSSLVICWERTISPEIVPNRWKENAQCWAAHLRCKLVEASFYKCSQQQSHHFTIHLSPRDRNTSLL